MNEFANAELGRYIADLALKGQVVENVNEKVIALDAPTIRLGDKLLNLEALLPAPLRTREKVLLEDAQSLIAYVSDFKMEGSSRIFFDSATSTFVAILDYVDPLEGESWGEHVATFAATYSEEWTQWYDRNTKKYSQVGFGRFIEEHMGDIAEPTAASLFEMVMEFEAKKNMQYKEATRLKDGTTQLTFIEEMTTGSVEIPDFIRIRIPVFFGQEPVNIDLRFRYSIEDQKLQLRYEFQRPKRILQEAAERLVNEVAKGTGLPVHMGKRAALVIPART